MSGNHAKSGPLPRGKKMDARASRTRARLAASLRQLMQRRTLDEITVQDVLNDARVSRSAFYAHFSSTQDLLLTDMDEFLERIATWFWGRAKEERILPVREFFSHVAEAEQIREALRRSDRESDFFDLAREHFARGINRRLVEVVGGRGLAKVQREALAHALAGALISQLSWWLRQREPVSAEKMDREFHALASAAIAAASTKVQARL